ncbi:hypothetical protein B0H11DRAFT_1309862 [Mycena galericulata]|nr:hypothetical protein B0H11DRAFT_1309862 [Mycena galericulata]
MDDSYSLAVWGNRVLVSAAVIYFYDLFLTFPVEIESYEPPKRRTFGLLIWISLRYVPALYQVGILLALIDNQWTLPRYAVFHDQLFPADECSDRCAVWDNLSLSFDTLFQISYISLISWRIRAICGWRIATPIAILGFLSPMINVVVSNPSSFPQCRLLSSAPTAR